MFGEDLYQNQGKVQPFGYTGYQMDEVAGTYFAQAREYLPEVGRFVAKDVDQFVRMRKPVSVNQYLYCGANPLKFVDRSGYDHYIFYLPEWENEALNDQKQLADYYGIEDSKIHLVEVKNDSDLTNGWNAMGTENGKSVSIETVIINTHATPIRLSYGDNSTDKFSSWDIAALDNKDINRLFLYGCNAGHLDYQGTNPASCFSRKVNGAPVLASDGTVESHDQYMCGGTFFETIECYMLYESEKDDEFNNWLKNGNRSNEGWIVYMQQVGNLQVSGSKGINLAIDEMLKVTGETEKCIGIGIILAMGEKVVRGCSINE